MRSWWTIAAEHVEAQRACVLVTVAQVEGSAPREAGAKMLVWRDGQHGTVGGGKLEFTILEQARRMLEGETSWRFQNYPLGPLLGQCCGGRVGILLERLGAQSAGWLTAIDDVERRGAAYTVTSQLQSDRVVKHVCETAQRQEGGQAVTVHPAADTATIAARIGEGYAIVEAVDPAPHLLLFGAGHVGKALAAIAASLPFQLRWLDTRPDFAAPNVEIVDDPLGLVAQAPADSFYLIFTPSHALDYDLTHAILRRGDFAYCGLIGSATKRVRFEKRLIADGIARPMLARLTCPIGRIGLASKVPEVMAVGIAAELLLALEAQIAVRRAPRIVRKSHGG